jgi:hypothetical protein
LVDKIKVHLPEVLPPSVEVEEEVEVIKVSQEEYDRAVAYAQNLWLAMDKTGKHANSAQDIVLAMEKEFGWSPDRTAIYRWAKKRWTKGEFSWREMWETAKERGLTQDVIKHQGAGTVQFDDEREGTDNARTIINLLTKDIRGMLTVNSDRRELYGKIETWVLGLVVKKIEIANKRMLYLEEKLALGEELNDTEKLDLMDGGFRLDSLLALLPIGNLKSGFESACKIFTERELLEHVKHMSETSEDNDGTLLEILEAEGSVKATELITKLGDGLRIADKKAGRR